MTKGPQRPTVEIICEHCGQPFLKERRLMNRVAHHFCSSRCDGLYHRNREQKECTECHTTFERFPSQSQKTALSFCSHKCSATYYNRLRRRSRRSKIEGEFFDRLQSAFPELHMVPNDKSLLQGLEADIAIPDLNTVIEWNGVVHYHPIYGDEKLKAIQTRDAEKMQKASDLGIRLIVISDADSSRKTLDRAYSDVRSIIASLLGS